MTDIVIMGISGKVIIFLAQKFLQNIEIRSKWLSGLIACSLCLGVWVFFLLSATAGVTLFSDVFYVPLLSEIITAGLMSFTVYLLSLGWFEYFGEKVYVLEK